MAALRDKGAAKPVGEERAAILCAVRFEVLPSLRLCGERAG